MTEPIDGAVEPSAEDSSLEALHDALSDLRRALRARIAKPSSLRAASAPSQVAAPAVDPAPAVSVAFEESMDPAASLDASAELDLDPATLERIRPLLDFLMDLFWRIDVRGQELLGQPGPVLFVANRSGLLPYDGVMLAHVLTRLSPDAPRPRLLVADSLLAVPLAQASLARIGAVRASRDNAVRLLRGGHPVLSFPEGEVGAAKVFAERYQLKPFARGGAIRAAFETGTPIVPVGIVGAEEAHPVLFKAPLPILERTAIPFLPVTPTFPWLGALGLLPLPTKWIIHFGKPIAPGALHDGSVGEDGRARAASGASTHLSRLTDEIRSRIEELVASALIRRTSPFG